MNRPRDSQRQRLYDWEGRELQTFARQVDSLTDEQITTLVERVFLAANCKAPLPRIRVKNCSTGYGCKEYITIPRWARSFPYYAIHEATHAVLHNEWHYGAAHGPHFVRRYLGFLAAVLGYDFEQLVISAQAAGIQIEA
jgi:hypothetical protein